MNSGRKCLVDFNNQKTQLLSFDWFNNTAVIYVKIDGSFLEGKSSFKMLGLSFSSQSKLKFFYYFNSKTASKKMGVLISSMKLKRQQQY